jgi:menaquinone reductase, molybdopterin-binding-like subunit
VPDVSRRAALGALVTLGAGAAAACGGHPAPQPPELPQGWDPGEERWVATTCGQCPAGCGIDVRVVEGRAVKIEGSAAHPINGGGLGPKGQAGLQLLYHPDRIRAPLMRLGPRGGGQWTTVTWDTAVARVAAELQQLRASGRPEGLVVVDGEPRGVMPRLWDRFLHAYGSPNHVTHGSTSDGAARLAMTLMQGVPEQPAYDWEHTHYVLGFGVGLFESWCQTIHASRAAGALRRGRPGRRPKFVHVSPRFSVTAAKADEWIAIAPGTEGALALGLAHVLIRDGLYDADFVRDHTFGFDDWRDPAGRMHQGFRSHVLTAYVPEEVARLSGVSAAAVERLADELSAHRPAIALGDGAAAGATNQLGTAMAIHALNALLGSIERRGGVLSQRPLLASWDAVEPDATAQAGLAAECVDGRGTARCPLGPGSIQLLPDAILAGRPYPVHALILYRSNPVFSKPEGTKWIAALNRVPFVVSCSPLPDESTMWADLVLPDQTYLERWEVVEASPSSGRPVIGLRQPVVEPEHHTLATGTVVLRLAHALGGSMADAFRWTSYAQAIAELPHRRPDADRPLAADAPDATVASLLPELHERGAVSAAVQFERWERAFETPSGKFEFYSQAIAARLAALFPDDDVLVRYLEGRGVTTRGDALCLPHWEPPRLAGGPAEYPFVLAPYRGINYAEGGVRHLTWLRELPSAGFLAWEETIDLNPHDARRLALRQGDAVWLETPAGRRRMCVRVQPGTAPGSIGLPLGHGPWPPRRDDAGTAGGHGLLAATSDPLSGLLAPHGTRARLRKEPA